MLTLLVIIALCSWFLIDDGKPFSLKLIVVALIGGFWYYFNSDMGTPLRTDFLNWLNSF